MFQETAKSATTEASVVEETLPVVDPKTAETPRGAFATEPVSTEAPTAQEMQPQETAAEMERVSVDEISASITANMLSPFLFARIAVPQDNNTSLPLKDTCDEILCYIFDGNKKLLNVNDDNMIEVTEGESYYLNFSFISADGITPEQYYYKVGATGLNISNKISSGQITMNDGVVIADWEISGDIINFTFNEKSMNYTNVSATIELSCSFSGEGKEIPFDGSITVRIVGREEETKPDKKTIFKKTGHVSDSDESAITLNWDIIIQGGEDFKIVGKTLTDTLGEYQKYSSEFLQIKATDKNKQKYTFQVPVSSLTLTGSDNLDRATAWFYTFPDRLVDIEGKSYYLDDSWEYSIGYTFAPTIEIQALPATVIRFK